MQILCGNKSGFVIGDILKMDYDIPTATGAELGALDLIGNATVVASTLGAQAANLRGIAYALESVAVTTAAGGTARALKWVQFL